MVFPYGWLCRRRLMPRCGDRERVGALGAGFSALRGCWAVALRHNTGPCPCGACVVDVGWAGGRRLGGWCRRSSSPCCSRTVRIAFSACVSRMSFCEQSCGAFCSSCTQAAARCDGEGLGASAGADGLGVCQSARSSGQTNAVGFGAGRRDQKLGTVRRGVSWDAAIRLVVLRRRHCCSRRLEWTPPTRMGANTTPTVRVGLGETGLGDAQRWQCGWGPGGASEGRTFKEQIGLTNLWLRLAVGFMRTGAAASRRHAGIRLCTSHLRMATQRA